VIAVDANLLIYASIKTVPQHEASHQWLDRQLNESPKVGLPWASLLAFVRLVSNPRIFPAALPVHEAWEQVEAWLSWPAVWVPVPTVRHSEILGSLLRFPGLTSNSVPDAHLAAALAIEHDLTLFTSDGGYSKFVGLRWEKPI
jgi:uncharacterized protein